MSGGRGQAGFHLLDAAALVVGYSLASLLIRAYWPASEIPAVGDLLVTGMVYLWLGLAMSGPVVLLIRRHPGPENAPDQPDERDPRPDPRSWAELAWMILGFYWIGLTVLVVPVRIHSGRLLDSALLGVFPVLAALGLRLFGPRELRPRPDDASSWTHRTGVALLATWPFAWIGLIILGKSYW